MISRPVSAAIFAVMLFAAAGSFCSTRDEFDCVYINEVCWKNTRVSDGNGSFKSDWVELYNPRSFPVNIGGCAIGLKGTWLESENDGKLFVLPSYTMSPGEYLVVFFNKDEPSAVTYAERVVNGVKKSVPYIRTNRFSLGKNADGTAQDGVRLFVPREHTRVSNFKVDRILDDDTSYGWVYDGSFDPCGRQDVSLRVFANPTPWASNAGGVGPVVPDPTLRINEVCWSNSTVDDGTGNRDCDFVELYNPGPQAVNLGGMKLGKKSTVDDCGAAVFRFPDYLLEAGEFFVVFFNRDVAPSTTTVTRLVNGVEKSVPLIRSDVFSLGTGTSAEVPGSEGTNVVVQDSVRLFAADGRRIDGLRGEDVAAAVGVVRDAGSGEWRALVEKETSVGLMPDGKGGLVRLYRLTPWESNSGGLSRRSSVVINEVCWSNSTVDDGTGNQDSDWLELYNTGPDAVSLGGMKIGKKSTLEKCGESVLTLPDYTLDPKEFLVVFFDKNLSPATTTVERLVNGVEKSVPVIRSNVFSLGTATSTEVPGSEGTNVVVQDSVRLFAADGTRLSNYKGEDVAAETGVKPVGSVFSGLLDDDETYGYLRDGNRLPSGEEPPAGERGKFVLERATAWGPNSGDAPAAVGFAAWQAANYDEQVIRRDETVVQPEAVAVSKGGRDYTNRELFVFGVSRSEAELLSADELRRRTSLGISLGAAPSLSYGCSPYGGVGAEVKVAESLADGWRTARTGVDVGPAETNRSESGGWTVTVPLLTDGGGRFYRLEIGADGR